MKVFKIFIINPGSTSTKLSLFEDENCLFTEETFHDSPELLKFPSINAQLDFRMEVAERFFREKGLSVEDLDAVVGRGGGCCSVEGGVYAIDELLVRDTRESRSGLYHASMLGVQMASRLAKGTGIPMFMMDPPVVDEFCDFARVTGVQGVYRKSTCHALNLKAVARKHAAVLGKDYKDCNLIVSHIDGGITVTAHRKGRMIDGNNGGGGDGPFTPTRMGSMAVTDLLTEFDGVTKEQLRVLCSQGGGLSSYFGTSNSDTVHALVEQGDSKAVRVWNAMLYQTAKLIGSMAAVLEGKVDAIVLTGGLLRFPDVEESIRRYCGWIAPVAAYPGEYEQEAMALGALRVLRGEEPAKTYTGRPVWDGFPDEKGEKAL